MNAIYADCTVECEHMPRCVVCQDIKKPIGRSAPLGTVYCSSHCRGYMEEPMPGHLWPGELADIRGEEDPNDAG